MQIDRIAKLRLCVADAGQIVALLPPHDAVWDDRADRDRLGLMF